MQPADARRPFQSPRTPPPPVAERFAPGDPETGFDTTPTAPAASAPLQLAAPALLIEARFRGVTLASRLLRADAPNTFAIGDARGTDAPVNPAWLPDTGAAPGPRRHVFLEPAPGGFVLNLSGAMRPRLETERQALALGPDTGRAEAPLALPAGSCLHVPCGEVSFIIHPTEPAAPVPRPLLPPRWREGAIYPIAVAIAIGLLMLAIHLVPGDPRALSLDLIDDGGRLARTVTIPLELKAPAIDSARTLLQTAGGSGSAAAAKPAGRAGDRKAARNVDRRMAIRGTALPHDARAVTAQIHASTLLAVLDGPRQSALAEVLADGPAMGSDAADVLGHLVGTTIGEAYGLGGISLIGSGSGGGGEGEHTIGGGGPLGTTGRFGGNGGPRYGWGPGVGGLGTRHAGVPETLPGIANVRGNLDKEIIRRIVRRNINQVRYCYQNALVRRPSLQGRLVTQFTIAPTGRVLAAVVQSSTLKEVSVEACVVNAIKRWEFPTPNGGGLAMVSYPFTFAPAGGE
ncbi:MAG TPA: AgmX/PglI C-terminal domain-containing protein [Polyangia bacterium]|jgi:TonB family protein